MRNEPPGARRKKAHAQGAAAVTAADPLAPARSWLASRGWSPFPFQEQVWSAYLNGKSGLLHAPTGMGKTLAVALGPLLEEVARRGEGGSRKRERGLKVLWLTPLRALANDTAEALASAVEGLGLNWSVELRTGDTAQSRKRKQRVDGLPNILVTTPESLSVMLSYPDLVGEAGGKTPSSAAGGPAGPSPAEPGEGGTLSPLAGIRAVIVDEWHELLGTKRGVQTELGLARVRALSPSVRTWGLSATLGNLDEAMRVLLGAGAPQGVMVRGQGRREYQFRTIIPPDIERFPWAGHLGIRLLPQVCEAIDASNLTLLFTNTRSQSEIWFSSLLRASNKYMGKVAIHHGSLDRKLRGRVEEAVKAGELKCVVCTSSLDLGVDFAPVDQVIQIGSPKGIARFLQRAGRSGHQPGGVSKIVCVPTNALELVEFAAARDAIAAEGGPVDVEEREPLVLAMDVLVQHMMTVAVGGGFDERRLLAEVRTTNAFNALTDDQWRWAMDYIHRGGPALTAYAHYARATQDDPPDGLWRMSAASLVRNHRLNIGTITSDASIAVRMANGKVLGSVEESFIGRMAPGDIFAFSGRVLELVRVRDMTAVVRPARRARGNVPSWQGSRMAISTHLASAVRVRLGEAHRGVYRGPEMKAAEPILRLQDAWSTLPQPGELLIEYATTSEGHHAFVYPLEGRLVHEGLAALAAWRFARAEPRTFVLASNDYGFHLLSPTPIQFREADWRSALSPAGLTEDLLACLNAAQLARRQFREIARVAGLIIPGFPGQGRSNRHLQASSELFYDVFSEYDAGNLLLDQARRQVLERQLEYRRLAGALERLADATLAVKDLPCLSPFAFPLWVDSLREQLTTEKWTDRLSRMLVTLETRAGGPPAGRAACSKGKARGTP
ncbi:MAG: ligase-associated DNA damage response DEXH box helicase [Phycisphaerales bacterium]|nr:ligase-associated DNA damage response DEXH box helicase [Phycisphaerales bacterium]